MKHEAHIGETINAYKVLVGNLKELDHNKGLGLDGNKILKRAINSEGGCGLESSCGQSN
jgi:hypothetical protein